MSPSIKSVFKFFAVSSICLVGGYFGVKLVQKVVKTDPMKPYRYVATPADKQPPSMQIKDAVMRSYANGELVHEADVAELSTTDDRSIAIAKKISLGKIFQKGKLIFNYIAGEAAWNDANRRLDVSGNMRLYNSDMDLTSKNLTYLEPENQISVKQAISGQFYGGKITTANLEYNFTTKRYATKNIVWQGKPGTKVEGIPAEKSQRQWTIKAKESSGGIDDKEEYLEAEATDGETVIKAKKVVRDVKTDVLVASGDVRYFGPDANLICEKATIFRKERRAICEGRVTMLIKPKGEAKLKVEPLTPMRPIVPEEIVNTRPPAPKTEGEDPIRTSKNIREFPVTVTAAKIEYFYKKGERRAIISGNPQARQTLGELSWRHIWAHDALYNGETEELKLLSKPGEKTVRSRNSRGDDLKAKSITIFTKRDVERWRAEDMELMTYPDEDVDITTPESGDPPKKENQKPPTLKGSI